MGFFPIIFTSILMFLFLTVSLFILKIFTGKSIRDPNYPPVKGTVFHMFLYFNSVYNYQTVVAKTHSTFQLLVLDRSEVYTADTRNIEHVLKTNFASYSKGAFTQSILSDIFGQGIFVVDGEKWKQQRKLASFEFSTRVLRDASCSVFIRSVAKLVRVVFGISSSGGVCNMRPKRFVELFFSCLDLLMRCTLDSIFKVGFGIELHCLEGSSKEGTAFMKAFDESTALTYFRYIDPFWKLKRIFNLVIRVRKTYSKGIVLHTSFFPSYAPQFISDLRIVEIKRELKGKINKGVQKEKQGIEKEDILSRFVLENVKNPEEMNDKHMRDIILTFMFAGKDTSATTLSWLFYMLSKNPLIQEKVVQVRDVVGNQVGEAKVDEFVENITEETLERMHYLHAALTDLKDLPCSSNNADDILPDGFRVRKGDNVNYITYAMGRMPYIWGKDADDFQPERWLENGIFKPESPFKLVAFRAGPQICLGKDFAYRQMKIVAMALLSFFRFKLADETKMVTYRTMFTLQIYRWQSPYDCRSQNNLSNFFYALKNNVQGLSTMQKFVPMWFRLEFLGSLNPTFPGFDVTVECRLSTT
ncbi:hypothetical protein DVH24_026057 [Malus domestica]|uniref:Cytochrome P450 n=1 Tax=Malus domestica TaxID=3750 RepID=A0A498KIC4_MALDO|nr:hypothetical protein DVH24_026057 [Malus domestica]